MCYQDGMAEKTSRVGFRWRPEVKQALADAARADGRSVSAMAEMIVAAWLSESRAKARIAMRAAMRRPTGDGK
jgi:hypothetical protein